MMSDGQIRATLRRPGLFARRGGERARLALAAARPPAIDDETRRAAQEKTLQRLMAKLEERQSSTAPALALLEQNAALNRIVSLKTAELERERENLKALVHELRETQAKLLQAQKLEAIGQLAAGIAHEINTPIQYVGDNIQFIEATFARVIAFMAIFEGEILPLTRASPGSLDDSVTRLREFYAQHKIAWMMAQVKPALADAQDGLGRVGTLVSAMKSFSHSSGPSMALVDLREAITTTITVARNEWKYVADLEIDVPDGTPVVPAHRDLLNQVILNLVINAAHAIEEKSGGREAEKKGNIAVRVRTLAEHIEIRVSDDGNGIPARVRHRIFEPFFTTKEVGRGSGQGLAIAHAVVEKHRGTITFDSEVGVGTTFVISLPRAMAMSGGGP